MNERDLLKAMIANHLFFNHYPPLPKSLVSACVDAIEFVNADKNDEMIPLPEEIKFNGASFASAEKIIEFCHLEYFLNSEEE